MRSLSPVFSVRCSFFNSDYAESANNDKITMMVKSRVRVFAKPGTAPEAMMKMFVGLKVRTDASKTNARTYYAEEVD